ncbi:MAG: TPM domain-containing protein [Chitinophagaceae bacterium]|jgi:uncharacterized membrane protein
MWNPFSLFKRSTLLSASDKQLLVQAIQTAEKTTSGEIRVFVESHLNKVDALTRAQQIFIKNKMHQTEQRNGVLLYVALEDKKLAVLGDQGIHEKVGDAYWNQQVQIMLSHFKSENYVTGLTEVILAIGEALTSHFPYDRSNDVNELSDEIMVGK